jgi:alanine dehydrogenase
VRELTDGGHTVLVETGAGLGSSIEDDDYRRQNAVILDTAEDVFEQAELIVKVTEPQVEEVSLLRPEHLLFTFLHLAAAPELTNGLIESGATCLAYETVTDHRGRLPLLAPMSEVAGKLAAQAGAFILEKPLAANVMVIGGGMVGTRSAAVAAGMGATVHIYDRNIDRLRALDVQFGGRVTTCFSSPVEIEAALADADLVIGAVLIPGAKAPRVMSRPQLELMKRGAVVVDVSIDQGGCFETSRPTSHSHPTYDVNGVTHYCVANMPGAVPITSTYALSNVTLPYILRLAELRQSAGLLDEVELLTGLSVCHGRLTSRPVANSLGIAYTPPAEALSRRRKTRSNGTARSRRATPVEVEVK